MLAESLQVKKPLTKPPENALSLWYLMTKSHSKSPTISMGMLTIRLLKTWPVLGSLYFTSFSSAVSSTGFLDAFGFSAGALYVQLGSCPFGLIFPYTPVVPFTSPFTDHSLTYRNRCYAVNESGLKSISSQIQHYPVLPIRIQRFPRCLIYIMGDHL